MHIYHRHIPHIHPSAFPSTHYKVKQKNMVEKMRTRFRLVSSAQWLCVAKATTSRAASDPLK